MRVLRIRSVGRGVPALAPVPLRFAREARVAAFPGVAAAFPDAPLSFARFGAVAFASATTAFVSGDVSRVAALANAVSPAALVRLPDRGPRRSAGESVNDRDRSGGDLVHPLHEVRAPGRGLERVGEVLGHLRDLVAAHL